MKLFKLKGISKNYACRAAMYRRIARNVFGEEYFTEAHLRELHEFESRGAKYVGKLFSTMLKTNGFAYGKQQRDLFVTDTIEELQKGNFCKAEFLTTAIERLHNGPAFKNVVIMPLFAYDYELEDRIEAREATQTLIGRFVAFIKRVFYSLFGEKK